MNILFRLFWPLLAVTLAHFAYINIIVLPNILAGSDGLLPLDAAITGYTVAQAKAFFAAIQASGSTAFADFHATHDQIFPALYGATMMILLWKLTDGWLKTLRILVAGTPAFASIIDYFENARFKLMMSMDAATIPDQLAEAANTLTTTKYSLIGISLGIIILLLAKNKFIRHRQKRYEIK